VEEGNCVTNISHKFDGKGMEITSELRLKNLTHADIGIQSPNFKTFKEPINSARLCSLDPVEC
jgi:hypothetical protein